MMEVIVVMTVTVTLTMSATWMALLLMLMLAQTAIELAPVAERATPAVRLCSVASYSMTACTILGVTGLPPCMLSGSLVINVTTMPMSMLLVDRMLSSNCGALKPSHLLLLLGVLADSLTSPTVSSGSSGAKVTL